MTQYLDELEQVFEERFKKEDATSLHIIGDKYISKNYIIYNLCISDGGTDWWWSFATVDAPFEPIRYPTFNKLIEAEKRHVKK